MIKQKISKHNKPKMLYQLLDQDGNCVIIESNYWSAQLSRAKHTKSYSSQGTIVNQIKRAIQNIKAIKLVRDPNDYNYNNIRLYGKVVSKEDLTMAILALKIQAFELTPTTSVDLTFFLDKLT